MSRKLIRNAFTPAQEVVEPSKFAGRRSQVATLVDSLRDAGSVPVIYGERGLGKSSLAVQLQRIATGEEELLGALGLKRLALEQDETFLTVYVTCDDAISTLQDLQNLILHKLESIDIVSTGNARVEELVDRTTRRKLTLRVFEQEETKKFVQSRERVQSAELTVAERLDREIQVLWDSFHQPILILVDELDRSRLRTGLAPYLKNASGDIVKYVLVGIAQSLSDLLSDHASLDRKMVPVHVPLMSAGELADIIDLAMAQLNSQGVNISFNEAARLRLVETAGGFPWFVHALGQQALVSAFDEGRDIVTRDDVIRATRHLMENQFAQHFNDAYQRAVRDSAHRETVLRVCAEWEGENIPTAEVYPVCERLGVTGPAVYKGHLTSREYGEPLMIPSFQPRGLLRFRNDMFRKYILMRPSIYPEVEGRVRAAAAGWRRKA